MVIKLIVRKLTKTLLKIKQWAEEEPNQKESIYEQEILDKDNGIKTIISLWDVVEFKEGSQAEHLNKVVGFDEWFSMEEILQRIDSFLNVKYKNQRSLYPYIKTLVDCGFFEASGVGGVRKWRKRDKLIEINTLKKREEKAKEKSIIINK